MEFEAVVFMCDNKQQTSFSWPNYDTAWTHLWYNSTPT